MSFSYSGNPSNSVLDAVRFEVQDTDSRRELLTDEEIEYTIAQEAPGSPPTDGQVLSAAARCCEALARRFAAQADTQVGALQVTYSRTAQVFAERAKELRRRAMGMHAPWSGAQSVSEKDMRSDEPDRVQPLFARREFQGTPLVGRPRLGEGEGL